MRDVGAINFNSGNSSRHSRRRRRKPQPAPTGAARTGGTAKNPSKPPLGNFTKKISEKIHNQSFKQEATEAKENPDSESGLCFLRLLIVPPKLFIGGKESRRNHSPQPTVNNFAPPKKFTVNNLTFTRTIQVNTPGPEDECRFQNARRFTGDFRSGPGALMQRNSQSISPARQEGRDEPSIRTSIHQGPRVQPNKSIKL